MWDYKRKYNSLLFAISLSLGSCWVGGLAVWSYFMCFRVGFPNNCSGEKCNAMLCALGCVWEKKTKWNWWNPSAWLCTQDLQRKQDLSLGRFLSICSNRIELARANSFSSDFSIILQFVLSSGKRKFVFFVNVISVWNVFKTQLVFLKRKHFSSYHIVSNEPGISKSNVFLTYPLWAHCFVTLNFNLIRFLRGWLNGTE